MIYSKIFKNKLKSVFSITKAIFFSHLIVVFGFCPGYAGTVEMMSAKVNNLNFFEKKFDVEQFAEYLSEKFSFDHPVYIFYRARALKPFWYDDRTKINDLLDAIHQSVNHGLPQKRYLFIPLDQKLDPHILELEAMTTFTNLISDLYSGVLEPSKIDKSISVFPKQLDLAKVLQEIENGAWMGKNLSEQILNFSPQTLEYKNLLRELKRLKTVVQGSGWGEPVPQDIFLGYKLNHPNVSKLRTRLYKMGYLAFDSRGSMFDDEIKSAIQLFQNDHGLNDDGVAGNFTLQAMNISARTRMMQVIVNLERIRWDNSKKESKFILVNQPNFQAYLYEDDVVTWQSRVVIGLPEHQTQEFSDEMTHLIVNPVWHVPRSISIHEYLPLIQEDPEFLKENNMRLIVRGTDQEINPNLIDMNKFKPDNFPFLIKQDPSNINALGVVKFMFPNEFNIYMHDTPMKELFFKDERTFSHGCVRVQDPFQFAFKLLSPQEKNPILKFQSVLATKEERQINLKESVPVKITYRTVFLGDYGQPQYRSDIYGRDAAVFLALHNIGIET